MKKFLIFMLMVFCLYLPSSVSATVYLNNDPNFPMTGGHGDYYEYTDLNSFKIVDETEQYYDITVGYIVVSRRPLDDPYRTRTFRYWKDGVTRPQYYSYYLNEWKDIPSQNINDVTNYRNNVDGSYTAYFKTFLPHMFEMLQLALDQLLGIELLE